jgi:hypothetical protein
LETPAKNGENRERSVREKEVSERLQPNDNKFNRVFPLKSAGFRIDGKGATGRNGEKEVVVGLDYPQGGFETGREAGEFAGATVPYAQNNHTGRKPVLIPPESIGFCVEIKINAEIDMRDNGSTQIREGIFCRTNLFQSGRKKSKSFARIRGVARSGALCREMVGGGCQAFGRRASTAFQSTKFRNSSM